jgi:hypothetical protein
MENWRCKNLVFPRHTRNMAPIVGGTFKTLLHTHTHTNIFIIIQATHLTLDSSLSQMVQTSWVFSYSWALLMIDWKCVVFLTCKLWHPYAPQSIWHERTTVCLYLEMSLIVSNREGGPKRGGDVWCVLSNNVGYLPFFLHMVVWGT